MNMAEIASLGIANPYKQQYGNYIGGQWVILQIDEVLGVLGDPQAGRGFDGFHRRTGLRLGMGGAEETADVGLGGVEHGARA